jgi:hypothetical protein
VFEWKSNAYTIIGQNCHNTVFKDSYNGTETNIGAVGVYSDFADFKWENGYMGGADTNFYEVHAPNNNPTIINGIRTESSSSVLQQASVFSENDSYDNASLVIENCSFNPNPLMAAPNFIVFPQDATITFANNSVGYGAISNIFVCFDYEPRNYQRNSLRFVDNRISSTAGTNIFINPYGLITSSTGTVMNNNVVESNGTWYALREFDGAPGKQFNGGITTYGGSLTLTNWLAPGSPAITSAGTTGSTTWSYKLTAVNWKGEESAPSTAGTITTGSATLSPANYNVIAINNGGWYNNFGVDHYNVYRTTSGGTPSSTGLIGQLRCNGFAQEFVNFFDTGLTTSGSLPTTDHTADINAANVNCVNINGNPATNSAGADDILRRNDANNGNSWVTNIQVFDSGYLQLNLGGIPAANGLTIVMNPTNNVGFGTNGNIQINSPNGGYTFFGNGTIQSTSFVLAGSNSFLGYIGGPQLNMQNPTNINFNGPAGGADVSVALSNVTASGIVAAESFAGNGAAVTNVQSTNIVGPYFTNIQVAADLLTTNLNQWQHVGSSGVWAIASNTLAISGNGSDPFGDILYNTNFGDPFHWTTEKFTVRILQTNLAANFGWGRLSQNQYDPSNLFFTITISSSANNGQMVAWWGPKGALSPVASSVTPLFGGYFPTNTPFDVTQVRRGESWVTTFSNEVSGAVWTWEFAYQTASQTSGFETAGGGYPCFWASDTLNANISNWRLSIDTFWPVKVLLFGDSRTSGYGCQNPENAWGRRLERVVGQGVCVDAGGYGDSYDLTNWTMAKYLRPQVAICDIGVNDFAYSIPLATTEKNITNFWGINSNYCGKFYQVMPEPTVGGSLASMAGWVQTNYPATNTIDFYDPLVTYGTYTLTTNYSFDGVHVNDSGNGLLFNIVNNRLNNYLAAP